MRTGSGKVHPGNPPVRNLALLPVCILIFCSGVIYGQNSSPHTPTLRFDPIGYFNDHCQRCHGPGGSFYGEDFGKSHTAGELHETVRQMTIGPGQAPLHGDSLNALVAYHRSLIQDSPFVLIATRQPDSLTGFVTAGATVQVITKNAAISGKVQGRQWKVSLPDSIESGTINHIHAVLEGDTTTLSLDLFPFSHSETHPRE